MNQLSVRLFKPFANSAAFQAEFLLKCSPMNGSLQNKNILLGVCGGIAAYKSAELVRRLKEAGADVRVVMTAAATDFITPLTFQALSGHAVHTDLLDPQAEAAMGHIELARWADLFLVAPATANSISRFASGQADDLLSAIYLATQSMIAIAPAMNHVMWSAETTQQNIHSLRQRGVHVFGPDTGLQACGEVGAGRLLDIEQLVTSCSQLFQAGLLQGLNIMITAGPTYESIDPVRYIGNRSSGRMGFAIAQAAMEQGANVMLIAGPVQLESAEHIKRINVESAAEMHRAVMENIANQDIFIATAAVADYRPAQLQTQKIKKSAEQMTLPLTRNPDILAEVAALEKPPFTLGFAAETQNIEEYALQKMQHKNLQMIAANLVTHPNENLDSGFNSENNSLQVFWKSADNSIQKKDLPHCRKTELARQLMALLATQYQT